MRERLAFDPGRLAVALEALRTHVAEGAILSTCNRTEVYAFLRPQDAGTTAPILGFLRQTCRASEDELASATVVHWEAAAVRHLFRVASGLESLVLGEPQILGQIRDAHAVAHEVAASGPVLSRLMNDSLKVGKRARSLTEIARNRLTVPHAALALASERLGSLHGRRALVIGAGEMGTLTAKLLRSSGVASLTITNRTHERATVLAEAVAGTAIPLSALTDALADADVVFGAAGAGHFLVNPGMLSLSQTADTRPLLLIDLTVPRTFDPNLADVAGVALADMDDLNGPAAALRGDYEREVQRVEELVEQGVTGFHRWRAGRRAAPTIAALQQEVEQIRTRELERALVRLGHLSERDRDVVKALSVGLANKVLHRPVTALQHDPDPTAIAAAARALFGLDESTPEGE